MTSCNAGNICWWAETSTDICPCSKVGPLILIILGVVTLVVVIGHFLSKLHNSKGK